MINHQEIIERTRQFVGQNQLEKAFQNIHIVINDIKTKEDLLNEITNFQGRLNSLKKSEMNGWLGSEEKERIENKLRYSLLSLISKIEAEISKDNNPTVAPKISKKTNLFQFKFYAAIIFTIIICVIFYFLYLKKIEGKNMENQNDIIHNSTLIVYLKIGSKWDTLNRAKDILEIATCQLNEELFSIEFDLLKYEILKCEDLKFFLNDGFMDELNWPLNIGRWDKEYPDGGIIYKPLSPCQKDKLLFEAKFD